MTIQEIIKAIAEAKQKYVSDYDAAKIEKDIRSKTAQGDYKANKLREKEAEIKADYIANIADIQDDFREATLPLIESMRNSEVASAAVVDVANLGRLQALSGLKLSQTELNCVADFFGDKSYLTDKYIVQIAESNNCYSPLQFAPIDTRLSVLGELETQINDYINMYNGTAKGKASPLLSDSILQRATRLYQGGFDEGDTDSRTIAMNGLRAIEAREASNHDKGLTLDMFIENSSDETRNEILGAIAAYNVVLPDEVLRVANVFGEIQARRQTGAQATHDKAVEVMNSLSSIKDIGDKAQVLTDNASNKFLIDMVGKSTDVDTLRAAIAADSRSEKKSFNISAKQVEAAQVASQAASQADVTAEA